MFPSPLCFLSFLAPRMLPVYQAIARYLGQALGCRIELAAGTDYQELTGGIDGAFICGLAYVELTRSGLIAMDPLAAPVLKGKRYAGRPIYFSDVIVARQSSFRTFADLRGQRWSFNEPHSQSGYGITRYHLVQQNEPAGFFGEIIEAGFHERSIQLIAAGEIDGSAIDSHVLEITLRDQPQLRSRVRVIETLGPSTVQPFVVSRRLPYAVRAGLQTALLEMGKDIATRKILDQGSLERFVEVNDDSYADIRAMLKDVEAAGLARLEGNQSDSCRSSSNSPSNRSLSRAAARIRACKVIS